ncbi:hypothetical protein PVL29_011944 [Vitis rotundifolia]|uniref:Glycerol kinase n=1 Tax=Vitis rotundifolia TaxID=103349 RepID=A0AA38ZPR9_VITRO|nr:hypothetical protein PVL29_011944 [Vitis rotundifolia]
MDLILSKYSIILNPPFFADLLGNPVVRPTAIETTTLGAVYATGLAVGIWTEDEIFASGEKVKLATTFSPASYEEQRNK